MNRLGDFWKWLLSLVVGGVVWWALTVGGGLLFASLLSSVSGLRGVWRGFFFAGASLFFAGVILGLLRLGFAYLPRRVRRTLGPSIPAALPAWWRTPQQKLTDLVEEGKRLVEYLPRAPNDAKGQLVFAMSGATIDYPARAYEWEARVWRFLSSPGISQWRGLYTRSDHAIQLTDLEAHLRDRIVELQTILTKL